MAAYKAISFPRFALGVIVVSIPAILLEQTGREREAWAYVVLVLLMMVVFYSDALSKAAAFTSGLLKKR